MSEGRLTEKLDDLLKRRPIPVDEVAEALRRATHSPDQADLPAVVSVAGKSGLLDEFVAIPALVAIPAWGVQGLYALREITIGGFHSDGALTILLTLALGGTNLHPRTSPDQLQSGNPFLLTSSQARSSTPLNRSSGTLCLRS